MPATGTLFLSRNRRSAGRMFAEVIIWIENVSLRLPIAYGRLSRGLISRYFR